LPIAVGTTYIAPAIIGLFAGPGFLPQSAIALQVLIWFLPLSYFNGVTQYVLIAIDKQRFITISFAVTLAFNVAANIVLIPRFSYVGAAMVTIASEIVLLIPFYYCVRKYIGRLPVSSIALRPVLSVALMGGCLWWIRDWNPLLLVAVGGAVYVGALMGLRTFSQEEMQMLRSTLPRVRRKPA
jgi:O-antigen/teichoic acid export membrane protein